MIDQTISHQWGSSSASKRVYTILENCSMTLEKQFPVNFAADFNHVFYSNVIKVRIDFHVCRPKLTSFTLLVSDSFSDQFTTLNFLSFLFLLSPIHPSLPSSLPCVLSSLFPFLLPSLLSFLSSFLFGMKGWNYKHKLFFSHIYFLCKSKAHDSTDCSLSLPQTIDETLENPRRR